MLRCVGGGEGEEEEAGRRRGGEDHSQSRDMAVCLGSAIWCELGVEYALVMAWFIENILVM